MKCAYITCHKPILCALSHMAWGGGSCMRIESKI